MKIPGSPPISQGLHLQTCHMPRANGDDGPHKRNGGGGFPYGEWNNPNQLHTSVGKVLQMLYTH